MDAARQPGPHGAHGPRRCLRHPSRAPFRPWTRDRCPDRCLRAVPRSQRGVPPGPVGRVPPGQTGDQGTTAGILHLLFGGIGFVCLAAAAFAYARWASARGETRQSRLGLWCAIVVLGGFIGGAALARAPIGVLLLWVCVLAGWLWLALASARLYALVPHPVIAERDESQGAS